MAFVERDDVVQHLGAHTTDPTFSDPVLPRAPNTRSYGLYSACPQESDDFSAKLGVAIEQRITEAAWQRQSLPQLLHDPVTGRMRRAVEVQNPSSAVLNHKEAAGS